MELNLLLQQRFLAAKLHFLLHLLVHERAQLLLDGLVFVNELGALRIKTAVQCGRSRLAPLERVLQSVCLVSERGDLPFLVERVLRHLLQLIKQLAPFIVVLAALRLVKVVALVLRRCQALARLAQLTLHLGQLGVLL